MPQTRTPKDPNQRAITLRNQIKIEISVASRKKQKEQPEILLETKTVAPISLIQTIAPTKKNINNHKNTHRIRSNKETMKVIQRKYTSCSPKFKVKMPCLHPGDAIDRPETTTTTRPRIPEVLWQQQQAIFEIIILKTQPVKLQVVPTRPNSNRDVM